MDQKSKRPRQRRDGLHEHPARHVEINLLNSPYAMPVHTASGIDLRKKFLTTLVEEVPQALEELLAEPLRTARLVRQAGQLPVRRAVQNWAERRNLREQWVIESIIGSLDEWSRDGSAIGKRWTVPLLTDRRFATVRNDMGDWDPTKISEAEFDEAYRRYKQKVRDAAKTAGLQIEPDRRHLREHLKWLVRNKVLKESCYRIAKERKPKPVDEKAVKRAIEKLDKGCLLCRALQSPSPSLSRALTGHRP
jgi:hypothetical protein